MPIEKNTHFFNEALSRLIVGTTSDEFAKNYANASGETVNSSVWNNYFENGKEIFSTIEQEKDGVIDEKEFKLLEYFVNILKMPFQGRSYTDAIDNTIKNGKPDNRGIEDSRLAEEISDEENASDILKAENENVQKKEITKENPETGIYTPRQGLPESQHLKTIDSMSYQEVLDEIKQYIPDFDETQNSEKTNRKILSDIRQQNIIADVNSDIVDFHIGTFKQHSIGSCTLLSQLDNMTDDKMHKIVKKKQDEQGTYYEVTFPMDYGQEDKSVVVREEELNEGIIIEHEGKKYKIDASKFTEGDADVKLMEMAFIKRFGYNINSGIDLSNIQKAFTFPDEAQMGGVHNVTEELLMKSNHSSIEVIALSDGTMPKDFSYAEEFHSETGAIASWSISKNDRKIAMMNLKSIGVNTEGFEKLSNAEFLDRVSPYLSEKFGFTATLQVDGQDVMIEGHAHSLKGYNPETKIVTIANPYASNEDIEIPLDIAEKFLAISQ